VCQWAPPRRVALMAYVMIGNEPGLNYCASNIVHSKVVNISEPLFPWKQRDLSHSYIKAPEQSLGIQIDKSTVSQTFLTTAR